jgi:hypothetical protein
MKSPLLHRKTTSALGAALCLFTAASSEAAIVANFTDGNGTDTVDQYIGIAGGGWATDWSTNAEGLQGATKTSTVVNTNPLNGGGNYLSTTVAGDGGQNSRATVSRTYDNAVVPLNAAHTISFDIRLDEANLANFTATGDPSDYIQAFAHSANNQGEFSSGGTWLVRAVPNATGASWLLYAGNKNGTGGLVDSGVSFAANTVYRFVISLDPVNREYNVSINGTYTSSTLGFRQNTTTANPNLHFGARTSAVGETRTFSLDNVNIAAVPEPSVAMLGGIGLLALLRRRRAAAV